MWNPAQFGVESDAKIGNIGNKRDNIIVEICIKVV